MRYHINTRLLIVPVLVSLIISSCTKNFAELNTNPALVLEEKIKVENILSRVQKGSIFSIPDFDRISEFAGFVSNEASGYPFQDDDYANPFSTWYRSYLSNLNEVVRLTQAPADANKNAIARIFRAWLFQNLTDVYGDVPYTEAAKSGENFSASPRYDAQQDIYRDMLNELKLAGAQLSAEPSLETFGSADLLFGGDVDSWIRFANSLRLRMAVRVRFADNAMAQEHINDLTNAPMINENTENARLLSEGAGAPNRDNRSPILNFMEDGNIYGLYFSFTVLEVLALNNDPRLPVYFRLPNLIDPGSSVPYRARPINPSGPINARYNRDSVSQIGEYFTSDQFAFNLITAAEVHFLKAEAALAGLASADANALYRRGIELSMEQYGVSGTAINDFLASSAATLSGTDEQQLEQIIVQKYISLVYQSTEAWAEHRRTGYPKMWLGDGPNDSDGQVPRRLTYPADEYSKNGANVQEAASRYTGGDKLTSRVWWDAKAGVPYVHPRQQLYPPESW